MGSLIQKSQPEKQRAAVKPAESTAARQHAKHRQREEKLILGVRVPETGKVIGIDACVRGKHQWREERGPASAVAPYPYGKRYGGQQRRQRAVKPEGKRIEAKDTVT